FLQTELGLSAASTVADIGAGTGILSELLLRQGCTVIGVEPNGAMRAAAERLLQAYPHFQSVAGTAEATTLADASVDFVTAEQVVDYAGLRGRLLSSSYVPLAGQPKYEPMLAELRRVFDLHQRSGQVTIEYDTKVYYGRLN